MPKWRNLAKSGHTGGGGLSKILRFSPSTTCSSSIKDSDDADDNAACNARQNLRLVLVALPASRRDPGDVRESQIKLQNGKGNFDRFDFAKRRR